MSMMALLGGLTPKENKPATQGSGEATKWCSFLESPIAPVRPPQASAAKSLIPRLSAANAEPQPSALQTPTQIEKSGYVRGHEKRMLNPHGSQDVVGLPSDTHEVQRQWQDQQHPDDFRAVLHQAWEAVLSHRLKRILENQMENEMIIRGLVYRLYRGLRA